MNQTRRSSIIQTVVDNNHDSEEDAPILEMSTSSSDTSSSSDDSDSSSDEPIARHVRVENFANNIDNYSDEDFRKHFRLSRQTISSLVELYQASEVCPSQHGCRKRFGAKKEIHLFVWYVSNTLTYRQMGNLFGVNQVTSWKVVNRVASWLVSISNQYIIWPRSTERVAQTTSSFRSLYGISQVIGAIDGSHIKIRRPLTNPVVYYNRKGYYSILLQAVVDSSKRFIDVYCGEPGSMHDARVLRRSPLFRLADQQQILQGRTILLGDSAYPCKSWLVAPYKDTGNLTDQQKKFNKIHSTSRIVVENAFGLMKGRFRRLMHFTEHLELGTVKNIVVACCVLHNICVNRNDNWFNVINNEEPASIYPVQVAGDWRQELVNELHENNLL